MNGLLREALRELHREVDAIRDPEKRREAKDCLEHFEREYFRDIL